MKTKIRKILENTKDPVFDIIKLKYAKGLTARGIVNRILIKIKLYPYKVALVKYLRK